MKEAESLSSAQLETCHLSADVSTTRATATSTPARDTSAASASTTDTGGTCAADRNLPPEDLSSEERIAREGWGPTLRLSTLVLARGIATRVAAARTQRFNPTTTGITGSVIGTAAGAYAKARGWL